MLNWSAGLLAVALLAAPFAAAADAPPPPPPTPVEAGTPSASESAIAAKTLQNLDRLLRDARGAMGGAEQCFALESSLKADLARKTAQLNAEFNGKLPVAMTDLLWGKSQRIAKQHKACFLQYEEAGRHLTELDGAFATIEPKSLNVKRQRAAADQEKRKYLQMMPTAKAYSKTPAKTGAD